MMKVPFTNNHCSGISERKKKNGDGVEIGMCGVLIFVVLFLCWFSS